MIKDVFAVVDVDKRKVKERIHAEISFPDSGHEITSLLWFVFIEYLFNY